MFKKHKILCVILLAEFLIYALSPVVCPLTEYNSFKLKTKSILIINLLCRLYAEDDDNKSDQTEDDKVLVKKKRAVTRKFDNSIVEKVTELPCEVLDDVFVFSEPLKNIIAVSDIKTNKQSFKGFPTLFSGNSPPVA